MVAEKYLKDPSFRPKNGFGWPPTAQAREEGGEVKEQVKKEDKEEEEYNVAKDDSDDATSKVLDEKDDHSTMKGTTTEEKT